MPDAPAGELFIYQYSDTEDEESIVINKDDQLPTPIETTAEADTRAEVENGRHKDTLRQQMLVWMECGVQRKWMPGALAVPMTSAIAREGLIVQLFDQAPARPHSRKKREIEKADALGKRHPAGYVAKICNEKQEVVARITMSIKFRPYIVCQALVDAFSAMPLFTYGNTGLAHKSGTAKDEHVSIFDHRRDDAEQEPQNSKKPLRTQYMGALTEMLNPRSIAHIPTKMSPQYGTMGVVLGCLSLESVNDLHTLLREWACKSFPGAVATKAACTVFATLPAVLRTNSTSSITSETGLTGVLADHKLGSSKRSTRSEVWRMKQSTRQPKTITIAPLSDASIANGAPLPSASPRALSMSGTRGIKRGREPDRDDTEEAVQSSPDPDQHNDKRIAIDGTMQDHVAIDRYEAASKTTSGPAGGQPVDETPAPSTVTNAQAINSHHSDRFSAMVQKFRDTAPAIKSTATIEKLSALRDYFGKSKPAGYRDYVKDNYTNDETTGSGQ